MVPVVLPCAVAAFAVPRGGLEVSPVTTRHPRPPELSPGLPLGPPPARRPERRRPAARPPGRRTAGRPDREPEPRGPQAAEQRRDPELRGPELPGPNLVLREPVRRIRTRWPAGSGTAGTGRGAAGSATGTVAGGMIPGAGSGGTGCRRTSGGRCRVRSRQPRARGQRRRAGGQSREQRPAPRAAQCPVQCPPSALSGPERRPPPTCPPGPERCPRRPGSVEEGNREVVGVRAVGGRHALTGVVGSPVERAGVIRLCGRAGERQPRGTGDGGQKDAAQGAEGSARAGGRCCWIHAHTPAPGRLDDCLQGKSAPTGESRAEPKLYAYRDTRNASGPVPGRGKRDVVSGRRSGSSRRVARVRRRRAAWCSGSPPAA